MKVRKNNFNEIKKRLQEQFSNKDGGKSNLESDESKEKRKKKFKKDKKNKKEKFRIDTDGNTAEENDESVQENKTDNNEKEENIVEVTENNSVKKKKKKKSKKHKNNISVGETTSINLEKFVEKSNTEENEKGQKRSLEGDKEVGDETEKKVKKPKREKKKKNSISNEVKGTAREENAEGNENVDEQPPKKKGPSIRELKRQKAEERFQEAQNASRQKHSKDALNYISMWKHARSEWKFNKVKQSWIMKNLLDENYVPEEHYPIILEYFEECKGCARKLLIDKAMAVIKKLEDTVEDGEEIIETVEYKRARQLLQALPNET